MEDKAILRLRDINERENTMDEDNWLIKTIEFKEKQLLHLRPIVKISQVASEFESEVQLLVGNEQFSAKSITDLMVFAAELIKSSGDTFELKTKGVDAEKALATVSSLFGTPLIEEFK